MQDLFEVASGTTMGQDHVDSGKNNQDAQTTIHNDAIISVVTDGCSSGDHSEVGAQIGARLIVQEIQQFLTQWNEPVPVHDGHYTRLMWEEVLTNVLHEIREIAQFMGGSFSKTIEQYFLFTVIGALVTRWGTAIFSVGDGVYFLNGKMVRIGPFPGNEPPYLAYALTGSRLMDEHPELLQFRVHELLPTENVQSILIGTDGVEELVQLENRMMPGRNEPVGSISQFWDNRYFSNPFNTGRRLNLINPRVPRTRLANGSIVREHGLLRDDTTFNVIRRRPQPTGA